MQTLSHLSPLICGLAIACWATIGSAHAVREKSMPLPREVFKVDGHTTFLILPEKVTPGKPIPPYHGHGDKDGTVHLEKNSAILKERYDKLGGKMILEVVKGGGHSLAAAWFHNITRNSSILSSNTLRPASRPDLIF